MTKEQMFVPCFLPPLYRKENDGKLVQVEPASPCPPLLTAAEACRLLRLDLIDIVDPDASLRRYRRMGLLKGCQVGKAVRYRLEELQKLLDRLTESNPR